MKISTKGIGYGLAFIQDKIDVLFEFGFKKLTNATKKDLPKNSNIVKKGLFKIGLFIGDIGRNYYKRYNKIKQEKLDKSSK